MTKSWCAGFLALVTSSAAASTAPRLETSGLQLWLDPVLTGPMLALAAPAPNSATTPPQASALEKAADVAGRVSNVLDGPSPVLAGTNFLWALGAALRAQNVTAGTLRAFTTGFYYLGMLGLPLSYALPFLDDEKKEFDPQHVPLGKFSTQVYLLDFKKESALTGSLRRQPTGRGMGWDLAFENGIKQWGAIYGFGTIYQQTNVDSNEWATVYNNFLKLDVYGGWNALAALGQLVGSSWLARQELSARVGPSYFKNWVAFADEGSSWFADPSDRIGHSAGIVSALGYELSGVGAIDFGLFGGVSVTYQRGSYPSIDFASADPEDAALLVLVGFDDLRKGNSYTWERIRTEVSLPLTGFARSGSINIAGALAKYESSEGTSVSNRGLSLGGTWRF